MSTVAAYEQRFLDAEGVWLLTVAEQPSAEIIVVGDSRSPSRAYLALFEEMAPQLDALASRAAAYLDEFVDRGKLAGGSPWFFEGIEFGRAPGGLPTDASFAFSLEGDTYGLWTVIVRKVDNRFFPVQLNRSQQ
ncbi:hypothetical protein DSM104443_00260 [Usitatibacter rugosus]|uniref:Uncharacterized protein n=1 Tax=Usitatibacter rugosus TaxID=2732067 RepID=A0A6M4GSD7_9PROT|nr:hypothetical protein [Usitatibacter rugosus]QJR09223.1 hypothetical protein DSM104443_00260 [Usitatibacter rugosus]